MRKKLFKPFLVLLLFGIGGWIIPIINFLPSNYPEESGPTIFQEGNMLLERKVGMSTQQIISFTASPNSLIVQGIAINPRYYRSDFYNKNNMSFELMMLGKKHVYISYLLNTYSPNQPFTDGSKVIIFGCKIGQDNLWGANRIIVRSFAVIQLDKEKIIYVDSRADWICPGTE
ncbi:MAG: hypothetical protein GYA45_04615 [Pelolinea sp.]|jgi:hypothetical protein|nr:hypothetical protein [Pelolinea sp.]